MKFYFLFFFLGCEFAHVSNLGSVNNVVRRPLSLEIARLNVLYVLNKHGKFRVSKGIYNWLE